MTAAITTIVVTAAVVVVVVTVAITHVPRLHALTCAARRLGSTRIQALAPVLLVAVAKLMILTGDATAITTIVVAGAIVVTIIAEAITFQFGVVALTRA
jgi:hypothetical protein